MIARTARQFPLIAALVVVLALAPIAFAAKGGGSGGGGGGGHKPGGGTTYTGTLAGPVMVTDNGTAGVSYGDAITFKVTDTAPYYGVRTDCYQNGTLVFEQTQGFYTGWMWGTTYWLESGSWTSGAANCTATLFSQNADGTNTQTQATMSFNAAA